MAFVDVSVSALRIEALIGYTFNNKVLAVEAVQMAGPQIAANVEGQFRGLHNNKRLAVLGDAVLAKVLCAAWFCARDAHGNALALADWTRIRNDTLSNDELARKGFKIGLDNCVITGIGTAQVSSKMMATTVEALFGAIYEDGGDAAVEGVMTTLGLFQHDLFTIPCMAHSGSAH